MKLRRSRILLTLPLYIGGVSASAAADEPCDVRRALERAASDLSAGRADAALRALSCVEASEPNNPWLSYYTGAAHLQLEDVYAAITSLNRAEAAINQADDQDAPLVERIRRLRRRAQRSVLQVSLRIGLAYDTNVSFLDDTALREDIIAGEEDALFESKWSFAFTPISTHEHALTVGADVSESLHFRIDEFNIRATSGFFRYARHIGGGSEVSAQYEWNIVDLDNRDYLTRNALVLGWRHEWTATGRPLQLVETAILCGIEDQDYHYPVARDFRQDGLVQSIGVQQRLSWHPESTIPWDCTARLGYTFSDYDTDGREYDRHGHHATVAVELPLLDPSQWDAYLLIPDRPLWITLTYDWEYERYRSSRASRSRTSRKRRDRTSTYGVTLSQVLTEGRQRQPDLFLHLLARWTDANSNVRTTTRATPFTFEKLVVGVQLEWSW